MNRVSTMCDLLIKDAHVIDVAENLDAKFDIAIVNGIITAIGSNLDILAAQTVEAAGKIASAGLIDCHAHIYPDAHWALAPDTAGVLSGATTVFDGGSAGYMTFPHFLETYIKNAVTEVYAFLHLHPIGEAHLPELWSKDKLVMRPQAVMDTLNANKRYIRGLKTRAIGPFIRDMGLEGVRLCLDICEKCGVPLMIHIGLDPADDNPQEDVDIFMGGLLEALRPGDIIAHAFSGKRGRIFREDGRHDGAVRAAVKRGVILDACVGTTNFAWDPLRIARARGFAPEVISTDMTTIGMEAVSKNIGMVLSKFLAGGLCLHDVLTMATANPARVMGLDRKGRLRVGMDADITLFDLEKGDYQFMDQKQGELVLGDTLLVPWVAVKNGKVVRTEYAGGPTY